MPDPTNELTPTPPAGRAVDPDAPPAEQILSRRAPAPIARSQIAQKWLRFYDALTRQRDALIDSRATLDQQARENTPEGVMRNLAAAGTEEFHRERDLSMRTFEQTTLQEIEHAMSRMADGSYGVCEATGEAIPDERLEAMPWTRYSLKGQEQMEAAGQAPSPSIGPGDGGGPRDTSVTSY